MPVTYLEIRKLHEAGMTQFRKWGMPQWAREIVHEVAYRHRISVSELASHNRCRAVTNARAEAMYLIKAAKPMLSSPQLGKWFDRDYTSVLHGIAVHQERTGAPALSHYNLNRSRKRNAAFNAWKRKQAQMKEAA